jgi:hypothetical protein
MLPLLASLALTSAPTSAAAAAPHGPAMPHLLFVDRQEIAEIDPQLELVMQPPVKNDRVLSPTEPWESWAVFAYNHVRHQSCRSPPGRETVPSSRHSARAMLRVRVPNGG